jgi:hypothetical protein
MLIKQTHPSSYEQQSSSDTEEGICLRRQKPQKASGLKKAVHVGLKKAEKLKKKTNIARRNQFT